MKQFFITGTDTDVGKTVVASALLRHFNRLGHSTLGFKPLSAGCQKIDDKLFNDDALALQQNSSIEVSYDVVNPIAYEPPIAPHIAADMVGQRISKEALNRHYETVKSYKADITLVEGAGGWFLPLNDQDYLCDWVAEQQLDVILVVGIKLGCLNHALLTQSVIKSQGLRLVGWVANLVVPETLNITQNIDSLKNAIDAPLLATVEYQPDNVGGIEVDFDID